MARRNKQVPPEKSGGKGYLSPAGLSADKTPRARELPDYEDLTPLWSFSIADADGPWCISKLGTAQIVKLLKRLKDFETMPWKELHGEKRFHSIPKSDIIKKAQERLEELGQEDVEELHSLGVDGAFRLWGIRDG